MKSSFWYFIIHFWGIQFFDDGIDIWCPFFECQLGYTKEINYDMGFIDRGRVIELAKSLHRSGFRRIPASDR